MVRLSDHWSMRSRPSCAAAVIRSPIRAGRFRAGLPDRAVAGGVGAGRGPEALERSAHDSCADLTAAAAGQAGIKHRGDTGFGHLQYVDSRRRPPVPEVRDLVVGIL